MIGFNPWLDVAVVCGAMVLLGVIAFIGHSYDKHQKSKLRGATRIA